jgi:hypothetical protein
VGADIGAEVALGLTAACEAVVAARVALVAARVAVRAARRALDACVVVTVAVVVSISVGAGPLIASLVDGVGVGSVVVAAGADSLGTGCASWASAGVEESARTAAIAVALARALRIVVVVIMTNQLPISTAGSRIIDISSFEADELFPCQEIAIALRSRFVWRTKISDRQPFVHI